MSNRPLKWYFSVGGGGETAVIPISAASFRQRRDSKQGFFRIELVSPLVFGGVSSPHKDAYQLLAAHESSNDRCTGATLRCAVSCETGEVTFWTGVFVGNDMSVDKVKCIVEVKPEVNDPYRCLLQNLDLPFNILSIEGEVETKSPAGTPYEFMVCAMGGPPCPPSGEGWTFFWDDTSLFEIYWREVRVVICVAGEAQEPDGSGWVLVEDNCATLGFGKWARAPSASVPGSGSIDVFQGSCVDGVATTADQTEITVDDTVGSLETPVIVGSDTFTIGGGTSGQKFICTSPTVLEFGGTSFDWQVSDPGVTIVGTGPSITAVIPSSVTTFDITLVITRLCSGSTFTSNTITSARNFSGIASGLSAPDETLFTAPIECVSGMTFLVEFPYQVGEAPYVIPYDAEWDVTNATLVSFTNRTATLQATGGNITVRMRWADPGGGGTTSAYSGTITITETPGPDVGPVTGPAFVCAGERATYRLPKRYNSSYIWGVPATWTILTGQGTNKITVLAGVLSAPGGVFCYETIYGTDSATLILDCSNPSGVPFYWTINDGLDFTYSYGRFLRDVVLAMVTNSCEGIDELVSVFFGWNDPDGGANNYVTGEPQRLRDITVHDRGDVIISDTLTQKSTTLKTTLKKLLADILEIFPGAWFIDSDGRFRIEHLKFFEDAEIIDLRTEVPKPRYQFDRTELPRLETYSMQEQASVDFQGLPIIYNTADNEKNPCVGNDPLEHNILDVTVDLPLLQAEDENSDRKGLVLLQNNFSLEDGYRVGVEPGAITGMKLPNMHLGWANLHAKYHRWGRASRVGYMNGDFDSFDSATRIKTETVTIRRCCDALASFDPMKRYQTNAGIGVVEEATMDFYHGLLTIKLRHQ